MINTPGRLSAFTRVVPSRDVNQKHKLPDSNEVGLVECSEVGLDKCAKGDFVQSTLCAMKNDDVELNEEIPVLVYGQPDDPSAKYVTVLKVNM